MGKGRWLKQASVTCAAAALALTWVMPNGTLTAFASGTTQVQQQSGGEDASSVLAREQWFQSQRTLPNGKLSESAYQKALVQAKAVKPTPLLHPRTATATSVQTTGLWQPIGPSQIQNGQTFASDSQAVSGRVTSVAVSGSTLYVGSADGGVWGSAYSATSPSANVSWSPLSDSAASLAIGSVAVDPNHTNIIYAGTGEQHFALDSYFGHGVIKSTDGGKTWTTMGQSTFEGQHISKVIVSQVTDPSTQDSVVYVAADDGIYESNDGGNSWSRLEQLTDSSNHILPATDLVMSTSGGVTTLYAAFWSGGIYEATNSGTDPTAWSTWNPLTAGLPSANSFDNVALAIAPSDPNRLYAAFSDTTTDNLLGFYTSTNAGQSWTLQSNTPDYFNGSYAYDGNSGESTGGQGFYDNVIAVDPNNENHVFAGGVALIETTDGGNSWTNISDPQTGTFDTHPDQHALAFDSAGNLFVGNDGGVWELTPSGTGIDLNTNLAINQMYPGLTAYKDSSGEVIAAGSQDNGTNLYVSTAGSAWLHALDGDGGYTFVDPTNPEVVYAESEFGDLNKIDYSTGIITPIQWQTTSTDTSNIPFIVPFQVFKTNGADDILVGADRLYESTDGGTTFTALSPEFTSVTGTETITTFARSTANPQVIYAGTNDGHLYVTQDGGATWTDITPTGADSAAQVSGIAVDPASATRVTVTYGGYSYPNTNNHIFYSDNIAGTTGLNWQNLSVSTTSTSLPNAPVNAILQDGSTVYVGTDVGVFQAGLGQADWTSLASGLPNTPVVGLTLLPDGTLIAATHGRGAFGPTAATAPSLSLTGPQTGMRLHQTENLQVTYGATDVTRSAAWTSSNPGIAQVSSSGVVTAEAPGTATITAAYAGQPATFQVTVVALTGITASLSSSSIQVKGAPATLTVTAHYDDGSTQDVTGSATIQTSNANAAVLGNQVYGGHGGTDTLTITYQGQTTSVSVGVTAVLQKIGIHLSRSWVGQYGIDSIVNVTAYYNDGTAVDVTSAASIQSVHGDTRVIHNRLYGIRIATDMITASYQGHSAFATFKVVKRYATGLAIAKGRYQSVHRGHGLQLHVYEVFNDGSKADVTRHASWQTSRYSTASVNRYGYVAGHRAGTVTISVAYSRWHTYYRVSVK